MRLCFIAPGGNVHTQRWLTALAARGHDVLLIAHAPTLSMPVEVFDPLQAIGRWSRWPKARALAAERVTLERVKRFSPHVVHMHWLDSGLGALRIARRLEPLAVSVWGRDVIWDGTAREPRRRIFWKRRILSRARAITATSNFLAERTRTLIPPGRTVDVIPFGIDCARFRPDAGCAARTVPVIGFLKHYLPKYGPDVLLRAAALLAVKGVAFRVEMYGTKDLEPYRRLARQLGLAGRAKIRGRVDHDRVAATLSRFDIFAMPSIFDSESFGVAALEAAASAMPVVASRVGGVPEVVRDGVTGYLVAPSDPAALADRIELLLRDAALRRRLGKAGRDFILRTYRWETCVDTMEEVYHRIARTPR